MAKILSPFLFILFALNILKADTLFVLDTKKIQNGIELSLSSNINKSDLKISELKDKNSYRKIIDFEATLEGIRTNYDFDEAKISIAQFNPKTTRLVLSADKELESDLSFDKKTLRFTFKSSDNKASKEKKVSSSKTNSKIYITDVSRYDSGITMKLSDDINEDDLKEFSMKNKNSYRTVINFKAILDTGRKKFDLDKNTQIVILQYNPSIARVVINSNKKINTNKIAKDKELFIGLDGVKTDDDFEPVTTKKAQSNNGKIVVIDAGHGGKDGGAINGKLLEKNIVLSLALKIGDELKKKGYKVYYTRANDRFINLRDRTKIANDKKANMFISIHANASPNKKAAASMHGFETFFLSPARSERSKEIAEKENQSDLEEANYFSKQNFLHSLSREKIIASNRLAIDIQRHTLSVLNKKYKVNDGGVREAPFWVLVGAQDMPAVLVEVGYITHPVESKRLANKSYQDLLAEGIANGIQSYFYNNR